MDSEIGVVLPTSGSPRRNKAQTDQEESPSSPENKEEKEVSNSPDRGDEIKTRHENTGAGALDRGEGRGEGEDFGREGEEGVTANETEKRDEKTAQTDQEESPSSPENKEEKEVSDSPDRGDENKAIPENIGAGALDRAQMDQEESTSSPENKEEQELSDSPDKGDEIKAIPENIGAGALDRGEGRGEGEDFGREGEEGVTANETEKRDEKTAPTDQEESPSSPENKEEQELSDSPDKGDENKAIPENIGAGALDRGKRTGLMAGAGAVAAVILAILACYVFSSVSPPEQKLFVPQIDIFLRELKTVRTHFPSQRPELWRRSRIHLEKHLQTAHPTEPVSLILTAGRRAERTLHCLAQRLASSFSTALNASVLHIDGASKAQQDSDQVKLDIDSELREAFEGDKPVAVIHRFEELPPGSTLIFYRYCDHENAAYKKTSLIFTVLLGGEEELPAQLGLSVVEEMVDDHLQRKFLSSGHRTAFDRMDIDKYSGLWSRISHLILPVAAEERIEHQGC